MRDVELRTLESQKSDKEGLAFAKEPSTKELNEYYDTRNIPNIEKEIKEYNNRIQKRRIVSKDYQSGRSIHYFPDQLTVLTAILSLGLCIGNNNAVNLNL